MGFRKHLQEKGLLHLEGEALAQERKDYKKLYSKVYMKKRRKAYKRVELVFTPKEYEYLTQKAQTYALSRTAFCKACVQEKAQATVFIPHKKALDGLQLEIRSLGNVLNQLLRNEALDTQTIQKVQQQISELETLVVSRLSAPELYFEDAYQDFESQDQDV